MQGSSRISPSLTPLRKLLAASSMQEKFAALSAVPSNKPALVSLAALVSAKCSVEREPTG